MSLPHLSRRTFVLAGSAALARSVLTVRALEPRRIAADVCVYGGTASGIVAAVAATRAGSRVVVIEPSRWLGGMTGGGLMHIDWGRPEAVGGMARSLLNDSLTDPQYRRIFTELVKAHAIEVLYEHRLASVSRVENTIRSIALDYAPPDRIGCPPPQAATAGAATVTARVFIDCSYEGDLLAQSGVACTYGREAAEGYGESLAGVRPNMGVYAIDPYVTPGNPRSGLLPLLQERTMGPLGSADKLTMGYGFRWRFTVDPNQIPLTAPDDYDPRTFELYRRAFRQKVDVSGRHMRKLGVYEKQNASVHSLAAGNLSRSLVSPTVYGCNADYPDGDWPTRARIWKFHQDFMRGLTHFLRTEPAAPENLKQRAAKVGFTPGMFDDTGGWPHQLYLREARRMISAYVVTQRDLEGTTEPADSVGLASYGVDDWPYATFPLDGKVALQGGDFSMLYLDEVHRGIYRIPYRAIVPREQECRNLLVPVCCSASHIAMTSIRMEPVWMILGEAAGTAAALALAQRTSVQRVDYAELRARLLAVGARLDRPAP